MIKGVFKTSYLFVVIQTSIVSLQRWVSLVLILLRVLICQSKEETVLLRLKELGLSIYLYKDLVVKHRSGQAADLYTKQDMGLLNTHSFTADEMFARYVKHCHRNVHCTL